MYRDVVTLAARLPVDEVFRDCDRQIVEILGTSPVFYAAIAHFVFDDSFYAEDIIDNNPTIMNDFIVWLEYVYDQLEDLIANLRMFYEQPKPRLPYTLLRVRYDAQSEDLFVTATTGDHSRELGNQWRFLTNCQ